jgi:Zn ribbon nucleic-acid-binding protein
MIHAVLRKTDGTMTLALTLEPGNIARLTAAPSEPIRLRVQDMFPDGMPPKLELLIGYTEQPVAAFNAARDRAEVSIDERSLSAPTRPHCPECKSTVEQLGIWKNESPIALVMCAVCGCVVGTLPADAVEKVKAEAT